MSAERTLVVLKPDALQRGIAFEVLSTVKVPAQYLGDGVHLRAEHPVIGLDHNNDFVQVAYNNYDRAPFRLATPRMNAAPLVAP